MKIKNLRFSILSMIFLFLLLMLPVAIAYSITEKVIEISPAQIITTSVACTQPLCKGAFDTGQIDPNGCPIYNCPATQKCTVCVGGIPTGQIDPNGCPIYNCPATQICTACVGGTPTGKVDPNGCPIYSCPAKTCPAGCVCDNDLVTCPTTQKQPIEVEIATPSGVSVVSIEKVSDNSIAIKKGSSSAHTSKKLVIEEKKLFMETSSGNKEIKIMPDTASQIAITQLKLNNYEIELKDVGKPIYNVEGVKEVKVLGFIKAKMSLTSQVDAETGAILKIEKPWWSFLAGE